MKNWLKSVFRGNSKIENTNEANGEKGSDSSHTKNIYKVPYYSGLDIDFIDLIYFSDNNEKQMYIDNLLSVFKRFGITYELTGLELTYKFIEIENNEVEIDFLRYVARYDERTEVKRQGISEITIKESTSNLGLKKVSEYYAALNFISTNAKRKYERGFFDYEFEDNLFNSIVTPNNNYDSASMTTITDFALILLKSNNKSKSQFYLDLLFNNIEQSNVTNGYLSALFRKIGEYFEEIEDYENSLKWLELGLILNPKLGVKNKLIELRKRAN
jgi:hypothetical protein